MCIRVFGYHVGSVIGELAIVSVLCSSSTNGGVTGISGQEMIHAVGF